MAQRILATSAYDMRSVTFIVLNRRHDEESVLPIEISASANDSNDYKSQIQEMFQTLKKLVKEDDTVNSSSAIKRACELYSITPNRTA